MTEKYIKNCPICNELVEYPSKSSLVRSIRMNCICRKCYVNRKENFSKKEIENIKKKQPIKLLETLVKKPTNYKKNCPICNNLITYSCKDTLRESLKGNWKCRSCSQKGIRIDPEEKIKKKKIREKKYIVKNREKINKRTKEYNKKYRQKPEVKKRIKKYSETYSKEYRQRPEVKKRRRIKNNIKRKNPLVKMERNISSSIRISLKSKNLSKNGRHWENLVGYSVLELKTHIEKQFKPGMNWNNIGRKGWEIDHIIPRNFFKYKNTNDTEFKYCWSLDNLQPLWNKDNNRKADKINLWGKEINVKFIERDYFLR